MAAYSHRIRLGSAFYLLVGRANTGLTLSFGGVSASADDDDAAIGVELQLRTAEDVYFVVDYFEYVDDAGVTADAISAGRH